MLKIILKIIQKITTNKEVIEPIIQDEKIKKNIQFKIQYNKPLLYNHNILIIKQNNRLHQNINYSNNVKMKILCRSLEIQKE